MLVALVNGQQIADTSHALSIEERGLSYGDGVFETLSLRGGQVRFLESHLARLQTGCERLGIARHDERAIRSDLTTLAKMATEGVIKLIVTRGAGGRGYRAATTLSPTRVAMLYPPVTPVRDGIEIRWCVTRLARYAQLAGIKHLNRLEQVLAQNEWRDERVAEGLMLDTEGELICATSSNVFIVSDATLITPDLRFSGIRGVMREQVLQTAQRLSIATEERALWPDDLIAAKEIFVTNAVRGIRPVIALDAQRWEIGPITLRLMSELEAHA